MAATNAATLKLVATSAQQDNPRKLPRKTSGPCLSPNYFKSAQWSADGTCLITNSADREIQTFVVPPDLLDDRPEPLQLTPYSKIPHHDSVDAVTAYPFFNLQDPSTTLILSAVNEHPIHLHSALTADLIASYPFIHETTEAYIKPHCLAFTRDGSRFIAGASNRIASYNLSRSGEGPASMIITDMRDELTAWNMRGIVSALALDQQHNILAAGTLSRKVGLYDPSCSGTSSGVFSVQGTDADQQIGGQGVTQLLWSPCGRYLYIVERRSQGVMIYDIRQTGQLLGWLAGRHADTNQRMHVDLVVSEEATATHSIWAGGTDGFVRVWNDPHRCEGSIVHSREYLVHEDAVSASTMHHSGGVLATASGQRHLPNLEEQTDHDVRLNSDSSLRLWSLCN